MVILPVRIVTYLWRLAAVRLVGAFALLLGVYVLIDAIETASSARLPVTAIAAVYLFKLPLVAAHVAPLACAFSVLLAYGVFKRRGEWDAAAAAGIGPLAMLAGLAAIPLAIALAAIPLVHAFAPWSLARFEEETSASSAGAAGTWWARDGRALVKWQDADGDPPTGIAIERGPDGRATSWRGACRGGQVCTWQREVGWREGGTVSATVGFKEPARAPRPSAYGFGGASLASSEIRDLARDLETHGQNAHALRAELALRTAVAAGVAIVPALALALAFAFGTSRDTRLVGVGLVAAAAYWFVLAAAWNGVALGALSPLWVSAGVPGAFAAGAAAVSLRIAVRSSRVS